MTAKKYTLLIFDWDGTLMDSEAKIIAAFHAMCDEFGISGRSNVHIRNSIGLDLPVAIQSLFPEQNRHAHDRILTGYRHHFGISPPSRLFPEVPKILARLREQGFRMAIATGKSRHLLKKDLSNTSLREMFHTSRCAEETQSKPHPRMLHEIMEELAVLPKDTLMIGDTDHDLEMAQNANVDAAAITHGAQDRERLLQWEPRICTDSLHDLVHWLTGVPLQGR